MPASIPTVLKELPKVLFDLCEFFTNVAPSLFTANIYFGAFKPTEGHEKPQWEYDSLALKLILYTLLPLCAIHAGFKVILRNYKPETVLDLQRKIEELNAVQADLVEKIRSLEEAEDLLIVAEKLQAEAENLSEAKLIEYLQSLHSEILKKGLADLIISELPEEPAAEPIEQNLSVQIEAQEETEEETRISLIPKPTQPKIHAERSKQLMENLYQTAKTWSNLNLLLSRSAPPLIVALTITALVESFDLLPAPWALVTKIGAIGVSVIPGIVYCIDAFVDDRQEKVEKNYLRSQMRAIDEQNSQHETTRNQLLSSTKPLLDALARKVTELKPQIEASELTPKEMEEPAAERQKYRSLLRRRPPTVYSSIPLVAPESTEDLQAPPESAQRAKTSRTCTLV